MQGRNENPLTSSDKINGFRSIVQIWQQDVKNKNLEMFPLSQKCEGNVNIASLSETIQKHLNILEEKLSFCFPSSAFDCYDWVREPYTSEAKVDTILILQSEKN